MRKASLGFTLLSRSYYYLRRRSPGTRPPVPARPPSGRGTRGYKESDERVCARPARVAGVQTNRRAKRRTELSQTTEHAKRLWRTRQPARERRRDHWDAPASRSTSSALRPETGSPASRSFSLSCTTVHADRFSPLPPAATRGAVAVAAGRGGFRGGPAVPPARVAATAAAAVAAAAASASASAASSASSSPRPCSSS